MKAENHTGLFLLGIIFLLLVYFRWFLPFPHVASDLHVTFREELLGQMSPPSTWGSEGAVGLGEFSVFSIWNWPVEFIFGLFGNLGLSHNILNQYFALGLGIVVAAWGMRFILKEYKLGYASSTVAILFYLINTYILLLIDGGQLAIALAYFFFPLSYFTLKKSIRGGIKEKIIASLTIFIVGVFDIRFVYLIGIIGGLEFISDFFLLKQSEIFQYLRGWFSAGLTIFFIFMLLNFYWILPGFFSRGVSLPEGYERPVQVFSLSFANLEHALFLLQPHWYKNVFGKITEIRVEFGLIPILVFLAPILRRKSREVGFWLLVALVGVFLVKGANPPLPGVYPWLFENIPGFSLFRDSTKFFFLVALSYSVLIGITTEELTKKFNWKLKIVNWKISLLPLFLIAYFLFLARPVWLGKMTGTFAEPVYKEEFFEVAEILRQDGDFGRVFWIPTKAPLGYSSPTHPSVEASRLVNKRPFATGVVGSYEIFNFLREAPYMGELFKVSGIDYIAYPYPDTRREELKQDNIDYYYAFLDQLSNLPWIEKQVSEPPVALLETKADAKHFYIAPNTFYIVGTDRIYNELIEIDGFDLSENALIFAEEKPNQAPQVLGNDSIKIVAYNKNQFDVLASFVSKDEFIFPAEHLDFSPDPLVEKGAAGWWKRESTDFLWIRNFMQGKYGNDFQDFDYGGGLAIAEGNKELTIQSEKLRSGDFLYARVMNSSRGGVVHFYQNEDPINGKIATNGECLDKIQIKLTGYDGIEDQLFTYDCAAFFWVNVGKLKEDGTLTIKADGDINAINALISVPEEKITNLREEIGDRIILWHQLSNVEKTELFEANDDIMIYHSRISPTHYKVEVKDLQSPATLVFSETYDSLWEIVNAKTGEHQSSYPLYSLINGFAISEDGEYDIVFSAQRHVLPGLYLSAATLIGVIGLLIYLRKRRS